MSPKNSKEAQVELCLKEEDKYEGVLPSIEEGLIFMQDNAPCHSSKATREYLGSINLPIMPWSAQSPDLNPIENVWNIIKVAVAKRNPKNVDELDKFMKEEFSNIGPNILKKLVESMPRRIEAVINAKGYATKY